MGKVGMIWDYLREYWDKLKKRMTLLSLKCWHTKSLSQFSNTVETVIKEEKRGEHMRENKGIQNDPEC